MKKILSILLTLCLACLLVPAMAETVAAVETPVVADTDVIGTWTMDRIVYGEVTMDAEALKESGAEMILGLNADGTFTDREVLGEDVSDLIGTWALAENVVIMTIDGEEISQQATLIEGELVLDMTDYVIYLVPAVVDLASFNGNYTVTGVSIMGMSMSLADLGMDTTVTLTIQDGTGHLVSTYTNGYVWEEDVTTEFVDGKLITSPITMGAGIGNLTMEITRQEDGTLFAVSKVPYSGAELEATFILAPAP